MLVQNDFLWNKKEQYRQELFRQGIRLFFLTCLIVLFTNVFFIRWVYASAETTTVRIDGKYDNEQKDVILERINQIRKEACDEELTFVYSGRTYSFHPDDYQPLKWSAELEKVTKQRAVEAAIRMGHTRPNGKSCYSLITEQGITYTMAGENLAWNMSSDGILEGIEQFYREKELIRDDGNHAGEIGHYVSMINPEFTHTTLSGFCSSLISVNNHGAMWAVAQSFIKSDAISDESKADMSEIGFGNVEVLNDRITNFYLDGPKEISIGQSAEYKIVMESTYSENGRNAVAKGNAVSLVFRIDDDEVFGVSGNRLTAKAPGTATLIGNTDTGDFGATLQVLSKIPVTGISITTEEKAIYAEEGLQLDAVVRPENATIS